MRTIIVACFALVLAACGAGTPDPAPEPAEARETTQEYRARAAMVLDNGSDGPQLCFASTASLPPQCAGPLVHGWSWSDVEFHEAAGVKWGAYDLIGTWADEEFTLTRPVLEPTETNQGDDPDFSTPCETAEPVGPATHEEFEAAALFASSLDGVGDVWIDQNLGDEEVTERNGNDPNRIVLNVSTTGDRATAERAVRAHWPGRLCVSEALYSSQELEHLRNDVQMLAEDLGVTPLTLSHGFDRIQITVWLDPEDAIYEAAAREYGPRLVDVVSLLERVND